MTELEHELAELIIGELDITEIKPEDVSADTPLYGEGFGLDSIDILEIALAVSKKYGFQLRSDDSDNISIFSSLRNLSEHVQRHRTG